jgi:hypothetical protein
MLYATAVNGMVDAVGPSAVTSLYMDNNAVYYSSWSIVTIRHRLQDTINCLSQWAMENGISFSQVKSQYMHFT